MIAAVPLALVAGLAAGQSARWLEVTPPEPPPLGRQGPAAVFDAARGVTVLFGGVRGTTYLDDTWEHDGTSWIRRTPPASPPSRAHHVLAFDPARGRVVLFGGVGPSGFLGDLWEYDGSTWVQRALSPSPPPRAYHAAAWDAARGRLVLFGGRSAPPTSTFLADTWEYDGAAWVPLAPGTAPSARAGHAMTYDPPMGGVILVGGQGYLLQGCGELYSGLRIRLDCETWVWNGNGWALVPVTTTVQSRHLHGLAFDAARGLAVTYGGYARYSPIAGPSAETREFDGGTWTQIGAALQPGAIREMAMCFDPLRARTMMVGGLLQWSTLTGEDVQSAESWVYSGGNTWTSVTPRTAPLPRRGQALAFDGARGQTLLFGGELAVNVPTDVTWTWDGVAWAQRSPVPRPPARIQSAMAFDPGRGVVVLFGGLAWPATQSDTWEWNGAGWASRGGPAPGPRYGHGLAHDSQRQTTLLFGGYAFAGGLQDTWELTDGGWVNRNPAARPGGRLEHAMAYDEGAQRTVIFGGRGTVGGAYLAETWVYNSAANAWAQVTPAQSPSPRINPIGFYDSARGTVLIYGGRDATGLKSDLWEFDGGTWTNITPFYSPPPRELTQAAFDRARGVAVLFGGNGNPLMLGDTWEVKVGGLGQPGDRCQAPSQCTSGFCSDGVCCLSACSGGCDACTAAGAGECTLRPRGAAGSEPACAPYLCGGGGGECPELCLTSVDCAPGYFCSQSGACVARRPLGASCAEAPWCLSGFCAQGVCCSSACNGGCEACNGPADAGTCAVLSRDAGGAACDPYLCDGVSPACPASCGGDPDCAAGATCAQSACARRSGQGAACDAGADCASTFCADGVCCDTACGGGCDACALPGAAGTCTVVGAGSPGAPSCAPLLCSGASGGCPGGCATTADCVPPAHCALGSCVAPLALGASCAAGPDCASGFCADGVCCDGACSGGCDACDRSGALGACGPSDAGAEGSPRCAPYACSGVSANCPVACAADSACAAGFFCDAPLCRPKVGIGLGCGRADECRSGFCEGGVCCDQACGGACASCAAPGLVGRCANLPKGELAAACGPYLCSGAAPACPQSCAADADCYPGLLCQAGACQPPTRDAGPAPIVIPLPDAGDGQPPVKGSCGCGAGAGAPVALAVALALRGRRRRKSVSPVELVAATTHDEEGLNSMAYTAASARATAPKTARSRSTASIS